MIELSKLTDTLLKCQVLRDGAQMVDDSAFEDEPTTYESQVLTKYITTGIEEAHDNSVLRLMTAAAQIGAESGLLPASSPLQTALTTVTFAKRLNLSYLVEAGAIKVQDAVDTCLDIATANALVVTETVLNPRTLEFGMNRALDFVSAVVPPITAPMQTLKVITPVVAQCVSGKVKPAVQRGILTVSNGVRSFAHNALETAASTVKSIGKKVEEFAKKLLSI